MQSRYPFPWLARVFSCLFLLVFALSYAWSRWDAAHPSPEPGHGAGPLPGGGVTSNGSPAKEPEMPSAQPRAAFANPLSRLTEERASPTPRPVAAFGTPLAFVKRVSSEISSARTIPQLRRIQSRVWEWRIAWNNHLHGDLGMRSRVLLAAPFLEDGVGCRTRALNEVTLAHHTNMTGETNSYIEANEKLAQTRLAMAQGIIRGWVAEPHPFL